ncbi:hypothetical protein EZS27_034175 [termite gut metagenome]|uniref:Uncharacterized protein n=1 Tax=termite gut metagenome TaxID=433724 RepID=A0A5J4Q3X0_9ZZZZ
MNRIELLKDLLMDFGFEENACSNFFSVPDQNKYVYVYIAEDESVICEYIPPWGKPTKWSAKIEDKDFCIRLYSTVFFARKLFFDIEGQKEIRELRKPGLDGRIDMFEHFFSSSRKGKLFCKMEEEYNLDKEYFLKKINAIINADRCSPVETYVGDNQQGRTSAKNLCIA